MLEPLAGFVKPVGHATATELALNDPKTALYEFIVVSDVSVSTEFRPGQYVAAALQNCRSATSVCAPTLKAYPAAILAHTLTAVPTAALAVPVGQLTITALLLNVGAGGVKLLIVVVDVSVSGPV